MFTSSAKEVHTIRTRLITLIKTLALLTLLTATPAVPYSLQSHEELIDLAWKQSIRPILLKRFPTLTDAQLQEAHAYAYGGCAIQDFGYYPFGKKFFSDLTHYVRSGDFVLSLLRNAQTPNELAFAIGALSHYIGDTVGHSAAINISVPIEFPKLEKRYGPNVNYAEDPHAHVQTEFAFDINQLSKRRFAPSAYIRHVGLKVPARLLTQSFFETYGLKVFNTLDSRAAALRTYRFAVHGFIPDIARAETILHGSNFPPDTPSPDLDTLANDLRQASAENDWEKYRQPPGFRSHMFADFIFILPKVGSLKLLAIKGPTQQTEDLFIKSLNRSITSLRLALNHFDTIETYLPNRDLDTGQKVQPGGYPLTDQTYAQLLHELTQHPEKSIPRQIQYDIIAYYADPQAPITTKNNPEKWARVQADLKTLQTMKTIGNLDAVIYASDADTDSPPDKSSK